nr:protein FAR1-related sequence 5-like [Tanacetum cinerariifolium]
MVVIEKHYNHDMGESSMSVDVQESHQIVLLPKHFQQQDNNDVEFQPSPNGTPYWVPDVPEDEKPKRGFSLTVLMMHLKCIRYGYKFVPFTSIDHNQKCVTFGAALLSDETTESFCWMLEAFLKTHKKHPPFAVTDQDGALRNAIVKMFPESHHRLCMWHIT